MGGWYANAMGPGAGVGMNLHTSIIHSVSRPSRSRTLRAARGPSYCLFYRQGMMYEHTPVMSRARLRRSQGYDFSYFAGPFLILWPKLKVNHERALIYALCTINTSSFLLTVNSANVSYSHPPLVHAPLVHGPPRARFLGQNF